MCAIRNRLPSIPTVLQSLVTSLPRYQARLSFSYSDRAASALASFREAVEHLRLFIEDTDHLPCVISALSYGFVAPLLALESQTKSLTSLVEQVCLAPSLRPHELPSLARRAAWASETLLEDVQRLPLTMEALLDQASFHESHLIAIAQGQSPSAWHV